MAIKRITIGTLVSAMLAGCGGETTLSGETTYQVATQVSGLGTVTPASKEVSEGDSVQMVLQPSDGFTVSEVSGCNGAEASNLYFISSVNEDCTVSIVFSEVEAAPAAKTDDPDPDEEPPRVSGAISAGNGLVIVQFNEAMAADLIDSPLNFNITRVDNSTLLPVVSASFVDDRQQAVVLGTGSQINTQYTLVVVNAYDLAGNAIAPPSEEIEINPNTAEFIGTRPDSDDLVDSDEDGLADYIELEGWPVIVTRTDGSIETVHVSSDPLNPDSDNDGVPDSDERHGGLNPLSIDTDGDTLDDDAEWNRIYSDGTKQDTDGDGIQDGFEYLFFKTSPILADTDGDQMDDPTEVASANRNPLIADMPIPDINVGQVNLQLDTRLTYTDEAGQVVTESNTSEATLTQGTNQTYSSANESSTKETVENSRSLTVSVEQQFNYGVTDGGGSGSTKMSASATRTQSRGTERGSTVSFGEESSQNAEEAYHDSLTTENARDTRESITREVLGASMRVDVTVANAGNVPFSISNLELSAQAQDPVNRRLIIPIGSLVPENENLDAVNIGSLGETERGPFIFRTDNVFPQEIEELMKNPRGLIVQLANYDITDENGNNFAFSSQHVQDRTAGITFDLGNGVVESYRIATASDHDANTGIPRGISMARALEIAGLQRTPVILDGGNGVAETVASPTSDDVQTLAAGSQIEPRSVVVQSGDDDDIATVPGGDDILVEPDYATELFSTAAVIVDGGNGIAETDISGDDVLSSELNSPVEPGQAIVRAGDNNLIDTVPTGDDILIEAGQEHLVLTRFRDVEAVTGESRFWVLYTDNNNIKNVDFDNLRVRAGQQYNFAYVQDQDLDRVWAREEYLHGSSDQSDNTDGCDQGNTTDECDTLTDFSEINEGWLVQLKGARQSYRVFSNPAQADSDRDGLTDDIERACGLDPRLRDTDLDGLTDYEEITGQRVDGNIITPMVSIDVDDASVLPISITPYLGAEPSPIPQARATGAIWTAHEVSAECEQFLVDKLTGGFATDPLNPDTDGDFVNDLAELSLGLHPNDRVDGADFLDDDGDGLVNSAETTGWMVTDAFIGSNRLVTSDPTKTDTDEDGLPDLLEFYLKTDPRSTDTDNDGINDGDEYRNGGDVCIVRGNPCITFNQVQDNDYAAFVRACNLAPMCNVAQIETALAAESQYGTNPSSVDSDTDSLYDREELGLPSGIPARRITINGNDIGIFVSNPRISDTDNDGLSDQTEYIDFTNPNARDSDGDGNSDFYEKFTSGTNPRQADIKYNIWLTGLSMNVNAATALSIRAGRTLSECTFSVSVGDLNYDSPLPTLDCYYGQYIVNSNGATGSLPTVDATITTNGGRQNQCIVSLSLFYNQGTGDHFTPNCVKTGGTFDQVTFSARFYMQRLEE